MKEVASLSWEKQVSSLNFIARINSSHLVHVHLGIEVSLNRQPHPEKQILRLINLLLLLLILLLYTITVKKILT